MNRQLGQSGSLGFRGDEPDGSRCRKNSNNIASSGSQTLKIAIEGKKIVDQSVQEARETSNTVEASAAMIKALGQRSRQIGEIVGVINDIADQTNLLGSQSRR